MWDIPVHMARNAEGHTASRRWRAESPGTENLHISSSRPKMGASARRWRYHRLARGNHSAADGLHPRCYTGVDSILAGKPGKGYEAEATGGTTMSRVTMIQHINIQ